jgi:predicted nucleotidyltransferase
MARGSTTKSLPIGTQVVALVSGKGPRGDEVCPQGSVGVIVGPAEKPADSYQVRLTDGSVVIFSRESLAIRKHYQLDTAHQGRAQRTEPDLNQYIIYRCVVGSRAFGLDEETSDFDRRGVFLPPTHLQWSLFGLPEQIENQETQECYWEIEKFLLLALKANPNILECLYTPSVELATPLAKELLAMRSIFLSQLIYQTYNGYVMSQFKKLSGDLRNKGAIRWKHAMHLVRLLVSGITILREGFVPLRIEEHRERLIEIRRGNVPWEEINAWRLRLHKQFDSAFAATRLPEYPDYERANEFLLKARRSMVLKES